LAKKLSKELGVPWISADTLQNIAWAYIDKSDHATFFPHSHLKGQSNDETYSQNSAEKISNGYIEQGKTSYKAISMLVETMIADQDDFIIEGYQVTPEIADEVIKKYGAVNVRAIFLAKHDAKKFVEDLHKSTTPNDWIKEKTKDEGTFNKIADMVALYSDYFENEAGKYGFKVMNMDNDFEGNIYAAIEYLRS
jgi:2-phosphoglycerate kinase